MKKGVIFTGAGMSADSGISTFRDSNGLWANYRIEEVCTPEALRNDRARVIEFYNIRRKELLEKGPNAGHRAILDLLGSYDVEVVTQNIDDLHERAAREAGLELKVTHLHGELRKLRSSRNENAVIPIEGWEQRLDDRHPDGSLLRPFVVFFGESVPMFEEASRIIGQADILIVVGTSLSVYPAAMLVNHIREEVPVWLVDPGAPSIAGIRNRITHIRANSAEGLPELVRELISRKS